MKVTTIEFLDGTKEVWAGAEPSVYEGELTLCDSEATVLRESIPVTLIARIVFEDEGPRQSEPIPRGQLEAIQKRVAKQDDSRAMMSACGEYNCQCHYDIPYLLTLIEEKR